MRGQVAIEYLVTVGLVLMFLIPIWAYTASVQRYSDDSLAVSYANTAVNRIADAADLVWSQGPPARINVKVYIPRGVISANLSNTTVFLRIRVGAGSTDVVAISNSNLTGVVPVSEGTYSLRIEAITNSVNVTALG